MPTPSSARDRLWGNAPLLLAFAMLFWAGNFIVGRAVLTTAPPIGLAFWRWTLALIPVLWLASRQVKFADEFKILRAHFPIVILLGVLGVSIFNTFLYLGLKQTTSINALLMQSMMPLMILLVCAVLFRERPKPLQFAGVVLSLIGVGYIASRGDLSALSGLAINPGDLWVIGAVAGYAFYSALLRKRPKLHPLSFIAALFCVGSITLLPFYIHEHLSGAHFVLTAETGLALGYLVIFPSFLSYLFFNRGVELAGAARAGLFIHLIPVFGSLLAVIFLGENFEAFHIIGAGLIAVGLIVAARR